MRSGVEDIGRSIAREGERYQSVRMTSKKGS